MLNRPHTVFTELGTEAIENGLADPLLSGFYEAVMTSADGSFRQTMQPFLPHLSLCSDKVTDFAPPPIFYVGKESGQRQLFGDDWATSTGSNSALRTPDADLERASAEGYRSALSGKPYYGYARTPISVDGQEYEIAFERLIIAVRPHIRANYRICAYLGVIQDLQPKS